MHTQHTPGPWRVTGPNVRAGDALLAVVTDQWADEKTPDDEKAHNAHLIAAAPDLLAALQHFVTAYETNMPPPGYSAEGWRKMRADCRAAIAKVTGNP